MAKGPRARKPTAKEIATQAPLTRSYRGGFRDSFYLFHYEERPQFCIQIARQMQIDPIVSMGLAARNGLLLLAQCRVADCPPRIAQFVERQWRAIWNRCGERIFMARCYGYMGYEVMYKPASVGSWRGFWEFDTLKEFSPRDARPLIEKGKQVGVKVNHVWALQDDENSKKGFVNLWGQKGLWINYNPRYGAWYGQPLLEKAYAPWWEKWQRGGAIKLRQMRMLKDAWVGDHFRYPIGKKYPDGAGGFVSARDIVREVAENRMSGGIFGIPSETDGNGKPVWEYMPPTNVSGASQIHEYKTELDNEILHGLGVPKEVLEAAETGSGYSGRSIPLTLFLSMLQQEGEDFTRQIDEQIIRPLVRMNFNVEPAYELEMMPLVETLKSMMGEGGGEGGAPPQQPRPMMQQREESPQQFSLGTPSAIRSPGCTVGGVYYAPGQWVDGEALAWASNDELQVLQFADSGKGEWITIGGHPSGDKQHSGGVPVKVHRGQIVSGPKQLTGRKLAEIADKKRPDSKVVEAIRKGASEWKVNKRELREAVEYVHGMRHSAVQEREKAKAAVRKMTGLTAGDVSRLENAGKDYTAIKGFDEVAREIAGQFPELGLGGGYEGGSNYDDTDYASAVWDLLREGKVAGPAKHDTSLVDEAANLVLENRKRSRLEGKREAEAVPFSDA